MGAAPEGAVFDKLSQVRRERAPYRELARRIIGTVLETFAPVATGPVVEIGAGDGQLGELLPDALRPRIVYTEPTERGVAELGNRFPGARFERASTEKLPFGDGEVAAAIGLCVLDLVPDLPAAVRELARVLAPGAPVIHFLDQNPFLQTASNVWCRSGSCRCPTSSRTPAPRIGHRICFSSRPPGWSESSGPFVDSNILSRRRSRTTPRSFRASPFRWNRPSSSSIRFRRMRPCVDRFTRPFVTPTGEQPRPSEARWASSPVTQSRPRESWPPDCSPIFGRTFVSRGSGRHSSGQRHAACGRLDPVPEPLGRSAPSSPRGSRTNAGRAGARSSAR